MQRYDPLSLSDQYQPPDLVSVMCPSSSSVSSVLCIEIKDKHNTTRSTKIRQEEKEEIERLWHINLNTG